MADEGEEPSDSRIEPEVPSSETGSGDADYELDDLGNVKSQWEGVTIYLPPELHNAVELAYREASYECKRADNYDMQKLQDFYPLLVAMGLNNLNRSDSDDVLSLLEYIQSEYE